MIREAETETVETVDAADLSAPITTEENIPPKKENWFASYRPLLTSSLFLLSIGFGIAFGMALASKLNIYPLALLLPGAFAVRHLEQHKGTDLSSFKQEYWYWIVACLVAGGLAAIISFRIFQPYAFDGLGLNPQWIANIREQRVQAAGDSDVPWSLQWARRSHLYSFENLTKWGLGLPLGILAWAGFLLMGWRIFKREWRHALLWGWTGLYFVWQSMQFNPTMRYQLKALPELEPGAGPLAGVGRVLYRPWAMFLIGAGVTGLTLSVSVSLSVLVPLTVKGWLRRENLWPYILGANVTTFVDTLLAGALVGHPDAVRIVALQMACVLLLAAAAAPASAQLAQIEMEKLRLVYFEGSDSYLAPHAARAFLNSLKFQQQLFKYEPFEKISVLLADFSDSVRAEKLPIWGRASFRSRAKRRMAWAIRATRLFAAGRPCRPTLLDRKANLAVTLSFPQIRDRLEGRYESWWGDLLTVSCRLREWSHPGDTVIGSPGNVVFHLSGLEAVRDPSDGGEGRRSGPTPRIRRELCGEHPIRGLEIQDRAGRHARASGPLSRDPHRGRGSGPPHREGPD